MLKFKKKNPGSDNPQGIFAQGNAFRRFWSQSLLAIVVTILLAFSYLLLMRESWVEAEKVQQVAESIATRQAASVDQLFAGFSERLRAAASSPLALSAVRSGDADDIALVEKAIMDFFPGVASIRLIAIERGGPGREWSNLGLRNHIEVDLLRRTSEEGNTVPESYQFEDRWLTSLAALVQHPRDERSRAVILATFDNAVISKTLSAIGGDQGRSSLQQIYRSGNFSRADEIAVAGEGREEDYQSSMPLNEGQWTLVFTPSRAMLDAMAVNSLPVVIVGVLLLLVALAGFAALLVLFEKFLAAEVDRITAAAEKKGPLELGIPQLLPLAKLLRRATLRHTSRVGGARKRVTANDAISDPMFQKTNMIDEEEEDDDQQAPATARPAPAPELDADFPAHIFRAYDIRGIVPGELEEDLVTRIGAALGTLAGEQEQQALIVACDARKSSAGIKNTLVKALLGSGRDVIDIGVVPTPLLYYALQTLDSKSGVMVTGSHNPPEYNGLKITLDGKPLAGEGLVALRDRVAEGKFSEGAGRLAKQDVRADYVDAVVSDMAIAAPLKIVVDAGNGVAGELGPQLLEELGCEVIPLYCEIDGSFPNHHPDPSVEANLADLQERVREEEADFGVAFDGDGDRLAVVTAAGDIVRTDKLLMLYAQDVVARNPGADVVFDVKCSRHLTQLISRYGGRPIMWKTGHAFMREKMIETGALLGGEFSGHVFFGERWYGFDDGMYAAARLAEILSGAGTDLASLLSEFPDTESTPEIRIPVAEDEKFELMDRITRGGNFSPGKVNTLDGVRVDYKDGWGLIRASNTTPALIARFEAHDADSLERIKQQFRDQFADIEPDLEIGF